jgi:hypothetical protein
MVANAVVVNVPVSQQSYNYDEIRTSSGTTCRQALGSNLSVEMGVIAEDSSSGQDYFSDINNGYKSDADTGAIYGRVVYQIGAPKRLDCSRLYEMEIQTLKNELELMRANMMYGMEQDE